MANNNQKKYASLTSLQNFANLIKSLFATKSEMNTALSNKADKTHNHNDIYYTESEIDAKLSGKSDAEHNHNNLYYTKTEIDNYELITVDDIDTICGGEIVATNARGMKF